MTRDAAEADARMLNLTVMLGGRDELAVDDAAAERSPGGGVGDRGLRSKCVHLWLRDRRQPGASPLI